MGAHLRTAWDAGSICFCLVVAFEKLQCVDWLSGTQSETCLNRLVVQRDSEKSHLQAAEGISALSQKVVEGAS